MYNSVTYVLTTSVACGYLITSRNYLHLTSGFFMVSVLLIFFVFCVVLCFVCFCPVSCLSLSCVLFVQCCHCLWIVPSFFLSFIYNLLISNCSYIFKANFELLCFRFFNTFGYIYNLT